jgi:hypothetical protein
MKNIKDNYIVIQGWMVQDLNLSGNELMTFALIYGFCQDKESEFTGSINYVCTWLNCARPTVRRILSNLVEKGLIIKREIHKNGVQFNTYKVDVQGVTKCYGGGNKLLHGGGNEMLPNNIINNNTINNNRVEPTPEIFENKNEISLIKTEEERKKVAPKKENKPQPQKFKVPKFESVSFTLEQMRALEERFGSDTEWIIKTLHNYKMSKGATYKSDYHAIFTWVIDKYLKEKKPQKIGSMNVSNMPKYDFDNIPDPLKDFR